MRMLAKCWDDISLLLRQIIKVTFDGRDNYSLIVFKDNIISILEQDQCCTCPSINSSENMYVSRSY